MIAELLAASPPALAGFSTCLAIGPDAARRASCLREPARFAEVVAMFSDRFGGADERAVLSYWTLYYFAALIVPTMTALVRLRRVLPVALDATGFDLDAEGKVGRFWLADEGRPVERDGGGMTPLVRDHLRPFINACAAHCGLSRRVLWCNAGTIVDFAARELGVEGIGDGLLMEAALASAPPENGSGRALGGEDLLLQPYRRDCGPDPCRRRRVCCLRCKLPGVASCGTICPLEAQRAA